MCYWGNTTAFLLNPVAAAAPEPATFALLGCVVLVPAARRRARAGRGGARG